MTSGIGSTLVVNLAGDDKPWDFCGAVRTGPPSTGSNCRHKCLGYNDLLLKSATFGPAPLSDS